MFESAGRWLALKVTVGIRVSDEDEEMGLDKAELAMEAYPERRLISGSCQLCAQQPTLVHGHRYSRS